MTKPTKRSRYDWEAIKRDYRTGRYTLGELTDMHGASKSQISKRQAAEGWTKDLSHAVQSRTRDKVVRASLSKEALEALEGDDAAIVEEASDLNAAVVAGHRTQLTQMRGIVRAYSDMLGDQMKRGTIEVKDRNGDVREIDVSLDYVGKSLNAATQSLERLVRMERDSYGLDLENEQEPPERKLTDAELDAQIERYSKQDAGE